LRGDELPERVCPDPYHNWPLAFARDEFLSLMDEEAPEVREDLAEAVFPLLKPALMAAPPGLLQLEEEVLRWSPDSVTWFYEARAAGQPDVVALADALLAWAETHNIQSDWVYDAALRTMIAWQQDPARQDHSAGWFGLWPPWRSALSQEEQHFQLDLPNFWDPTMESATDARRRLRAIARRAVDDFIDRGVRLADERGFGEPKGGRVPSQHLRWLVRRQVVGQNFTEIARSDGHADPDGAGYKTVSNGAHQAAELIGLPLRDPDQGAVGKP
jgi:hypothetical protein